MLPMYYFEVKTKILVSGELWGYELKSLMSYIDFPVIVKTDEFIHLIKAGFISRVQLNDEGNPTFNYGRKCFDTMRSRNLKTPPITGDYYGEKHCCGYIVCHAGYESILFVDGLYIDSSGKDSETMSVPITDPKDGRIRGYRLYCLNTHKTYSFACFETHHLIKPYGCSTVLGLQYDGSFAWIFEDELADIYDFSGLPVFDLADDACERPSGGYLERTDIFGLRKTNKLIEKVNQDYAIAELTGETDNPILAAVINYFADEG